MSRLEFGRDRLPADQAATAPAWSPLEPVPGVKDGLQPEPGMGQFLGDDREWHHLLHAIGRRVDNRYVQVYEAECGATKTCDSVRTRNDSLPTCERCVDWKRA